MTRVWLIRHGEPVAEARGRCYGRSDIRLSEAGRKQMKNVAACMKSESIAAVYASPLSRALESAEILANSAACSVQAASDLREIDFGIFEGLTYEEAESRHPELYWQWMEAPTTVFFPKGESFAIFRRRVLRAFGAILRAHPHQTIAIVSHGGINRVLIAWALRMPHHQLFRIAQDYAAINLLTFHEGRASVSRLNGGSMPVPVAVFE